MITVHHLNDSRSQRILWLLEELGLDYEIQFYERDPKTMLAPASLKAIHPLGKSPVITDGDLTLAESGAIIEYLVERYDEGRLAPGIDEPERLRYIYWLHYAEGSAMPPLLLNFVFDRMGQQPLPFYARPLAKRITEGMKHSFVEPQLQTHLDYQEAELGKHLWFVGEEFTAADIQMSFPVEAAATWGKLGSRYPRLMTYLERIHARPAYQQALKRGGDYAYA